MRISRLRIHHFRSIEHVDLELGDTTVFIGPNNAGKTAILEAIRIVLTRRWGQRGTGFTENDVHRSGEEGDPKTLPPIQIEIVLEEPEPRRWDGDMVAALEDVLSVTTDERNVATLRVTCAWNEEKEAFEPTWEFLDLAGLPMTGPARRATNLTGFFGYLPLFWLGALRDAATEFMPRSTHWGRLLRGVRIPDDLEKEAIELLTALDAKLIEADPRLADLTNVIGQATHIAIGEGPGAARLNTLPLSIEEMLQRTGVLLRNEDLRPWLPLGHHGQGLQSLAVIFLFQAAVLQQLRESNRPGMEAVFAIEEPEAHLHPQAARTLWSRIRQLQGQSLVTTHSPYFVQNVPLHDLKLVRLCNGRTEVASIPRSIVSDLPWNDSVEHLAAANQGALVKDVRTGRVSATSNLTSRLTEHLGGCYRRDADYAQKLMSIDALRHACRILISRDDESDLGFHGRRVRGEIFFARRWILVEGVCEYLLIDAIATAFDWPLDAHGISVIDFQNCGSPGVYAALGDGLKIPWNMIADGDPAGQGFYDQIVARGFAPADLTGRLERLPSPNDLEDQLMADGHENLLRELMGQRSSWARTCTVADFQARLKNRKTDYMALLAPRVAADANLAKQMPAAFVQLVTALKEGRA